MVISNKLCVPNKAEDLNLYIFNMITEINESKTLIKHIPCECKCKFGGRKCNAAQITSGIKIIVGMSVNIVENIICSKKDYIWNPATCSCKNGKYLASIIDNLLIMWDEITNTRKTVAANFN